MKKEASFNEATGQTIVFRSPEQLAAVGPAAIPAPVVPGVVGKSFEEIAHASTIEYRPNYIEQIPETVSLDLLRDDAVRRLNGQFQEL